MTAKSRILVGVPATRALSSLGGTLVTAFLVLSPGVASARPAEPALSAHTSTQDISSTLPASPRALTAVLEQRSRRGGGGSGGGSGSGGGQAVPRGSGGGSGSGGGTASGGGTRSGGSSGGGDARTRGGSGADQGRASGGGDTTYSRPRGDRPANGTAVERRDGDRPRTVIVNRGGYYGGFYPWGWGGLGLGGYYGYGYYSPWGLGWYDPYPFGGYAGGYGGYASGYGGYDGALKLKVKQRQAEVYVDGYFAGSVDDYDGMFQQLRLEPGPHRIEVRLDGYEPLSFEVRVIPDRTITYKGDLERAEP
jgi:hypothetical protein